MSLRFDAAVFVPAFAPVVPIVPVAPEVTTTVDDDRNLQEGEIDETLRDDDVERFELIVQSYEYLPSLIIAAAGKFHSRGLLSVVRLREIEDGYEDEYNQGCYEDTEGLFTTEYIADDEEYDDPIFVGEFVKDTEDVNLFQEYIKDKRWVPELAREVSEFLFIAGVIDHSLHDYVMESYETTYNSLFP